MSAKFTGVTFPNQKVTPAYDAIIRRALLDDGILTGCALSYSGSTLTMAAGQLMLCGRQIIHPSSQNWAVTEATTGYARLVLTIDLTRTSTKDTFDQVVDEIQYATAVDGFTALVQSDINAAGSKYQVAACVVSLGPGGITGIVSQLDATEGGGAGGILTVTAPVGVVVTASNGEKSKAKISGASGVVTFKGLKTGTWTVSISDGEQTATREVTVTADYTVIIAFFSATINVTYPEGSTCTATDGVTTLTAPDASGTWACVVPNAGTWTITATGGDKTKSADVTITENGQSESITLQYITYLFKNGDTCDTLTGGWNGTVDATNQALRLSAAAEKTASVSTKIKVDVTEYDTISFEVIKSEKVNISLADKVAGTQYAKATMGENATHADLDISNLTGSYVVWLSFYSEKGGTAYVSEVSLA